MSPQKLKLTVICPVRNEEKVVPLFFERFLPVREKLQTKFDIELLFTNNASTDSTLDILRKLRADHSFVYYITVSRDVGYQASLECGLRKAQGDLFVFIDVDCEDPPEMIEEFVSWYEQGFDIVYGERVDRTEPKPVMLGRKLFYRILKAVADDDVILDMAEFSIMTREVRDAISFDKTSFPFIRASIGRVGFKRKGIPYKRHKRVAGETHFRFLGMIYFAIAGILASSTLFLRIPIFLLPFWVVAVTVLCIYRVLHPNVWVDSLLISVIALYFGMCLSFMSVYLGRTYKNSLGRPNFIISQKDSVLQDEH